MRVNYPTELIEGLQCIRARLNSLTQLAMSIDTSTEVLDKLHTATSKIEQIVHDAEEGSLIVVEHMVEMHDFIRPARTKIYLEDLIERVGNASAPRPPEKLKEIVQNAIEGPSFSREQELHQIATQLRSLAAIAQQCWINGYGFQKEEKSPIDTLLGPNGETIQNGVLHRPIRAVAVLEGRKPEMFG